MAEHVEQGQSVTTAPEILVEVRPLSTSGDLAPHAAVPEEFRTRARDIADSIADIAEQFQSRLSLVLRQPTSELSVQSVEIEFNIALQAEAGVIIAKATAGATFTARLTLNVKALK